VSVTPGRFSRSPTRERVAAMKLVNVLLSLIAVSAVAAPADRGRLKQSELIGLVRQMARDPNAVPLETRFAILSAPRDLAAEQALARKAGLPLTLDEWDPKPPPPDQNAAYFYRKLEQILRRDPMDTGFDQGSFWIDVQSTPEHVAAMRQRFAERPDVTGLIERIVETPRSAYVTASDWGLPDVSPSPQPRIRSFAFREAARLAVTRAVLRAYDGAPVVAVKEVHRAMRIAEHADSAPDGVGQMVSDGCHAIVTNGFRLITEVADGDPHVLDAVADGLTHRSDSVRAERQLKGLFLDTLIWIRRFRDRETVEYSESTLDDLLAFKLKPLSRHPLREPTADERYLWRRCWQATEAEVLRAARRLLQAAGGTGEARKRVRDQMETRRLRHPDRLISVEAARALQGLVVGWSSPRSGEARHRALLASLAVLRYRARHGRLPTSLEEAGAGGVLDELGRPLAYKATETGFVVANRDALNTSGSVRWAFRIKPTP
jgi:hypothetical protein